MDTTNMTKTQLKVCSKHFNKDDFILPGKQVLTFIVVIKCLYIMFICILDYKLKNTSLKKTAVPSQNFPTASIKLQSPKKRKSPKKIERSLVMTSNIINNINNIPENIGKIAI